jgi:hypothetical protein
MESIIITKEYLRKNKNHVFVFGDNLIRRGLGGAAELRNESNTYGFITKKFPSNKPSSFFKKSEYMSVFYSEYLELEREIKANKNKTFLISKIGSGLANRHGIFEEVIRPSIKELDKYPNVKFLW